MKHTKQCLEQQARYKKDIAAFEAKYPNYCRACGGGGAIYGVENGAPWGEGYWPMPTVDVCGCIEVSLRCPLCGHQHDEGWEGESCEACAWTWDSQETAPDEPECMCWMDEEWKAEADAALRETQVDALADTY